MQSIKQKILQGLSTVKVEEPGSVGECFSDRGFGHVFKTSRSRFVPDRVGLFFAGRRIWRTTAVGPDERLLTQRRMNWTQKRPLFSGLFCAHFVEPHCVAIWNAMSAARSCL